MNERRVLIVVGFFIWQLICSVAYAADDETGLQLGVRLSFGGATSGPARLSLSIASSSATHGAVQSADFASLDFGAHGKLLDGQVVGIPILANGALALHAGEESDGF